jgi:serine kinase of HPr protein (carbohydrate metabolism regulator)
MRLIVTGKSRSGKTTAIDRLRRTALQTTWAHVLVADGKHDRLARAAGGSRLCVRTNVDPAESPAPAPLPGVGAVCSLSGT